MHVIYYKRKNPPPLKSLPPTNMNLALHIRRAHLQIMLWKAADKANPPAVKITDYVCRCEQRSDANAVQGAHST